MVRGAESPRGETDIMKFKRFTLFLLFASLIAMHSVAAQAQDDAPAPLLGPLNSDPLTELGISPRVLDIAMFPMSQNVGFEMLMSYRATGPGGLVQERFRMVYKPVTDYGRDLYIEFENEPLRSIKEYRRSLEVTMGSDYWVRQQTRLYDAKSLKVIRNENGYMVISFRYDRANVPSKQRWLLHVEGRVHIQDGVLERIDFVADKAIERDGVKNENYRSSVVFGAVPEHGGYVIDQMEEIFSFKYKGNVRHIHMHGRMMSYKHEQLGELAWNRMPTELIVSEPDELPASIAKGELIKSPPDPITRDQIDEEFNATETVKLDLQRKLPFWADEVRKIGFELPKTYGVGVIGMIQNADMELLDISIGGFSAVDDIPFIQPYGNKVDSQISTVQLRADFWLLPFLNLSVIGGNVETDSDVTLNFTPLFRALYENKTGDPLPEQIYAPAGTTAQTLGFGLTSGLKYDNLVVSASLNYARTVTNETNSKIDAWVFVGMAGYDFGDMGMQILTGVQYLNTDRTITGFLDLGEDRAPLDFSIDVKLEQTLFMIGVNKDIGRNWQLSAFLGLNGTRSQASAIFGYRW